VTLINSAISSGARKAIACKTIGVSVRTIQRWYNDKSKQLFEDERPTAIRPAPANKLSVEERNLILETCNSSEYASYPPGYIVPTLADDGLYIGSESTFYRVLNESGQLAQRAPTKLRVGNSKPNEKIATRPNQLWTWDISYLATLTRGQHYYLYMIVDIFSRKIVGAEVYGQELGELAADVLQRAVWSEKCINSGTTLHSDNGAPMRSFTMQAKMRDLGVASSYSRPRVSNDNPYSESLFRTTKYHHSWPKDGFKNIAEAREWVNNFTDWYNNVHKHSGIKYVTPEQRHTGLDSELLQKRREIYLTAQQKNPNRWRNDIRNWDYIDEVSLNPESKYVA
jgi:transposase InsO family protein